MDSTLQMVGAGISAWEEEPSDINYAFWKCPAIDLSSSRES